MGFRFVVIFIDSFMDDVTYVKDVEVRGSLEDQTVAHKMRDYRVLSKAEQRTRTSSQYAPYPCHHAGRVSSATRYGLHGPRVMYTNILSFLCKVRYCSNFINFYVTEANSHSMLPGQQIPLRSIRYICIKPPR